ncbi:hypothetical protein [Streptomyces sp. NBC_00096]|uniref:hypothetical protein n=1 Tax=Streptomyces sp. NBC_00096 TaxID=2975650 RepID=UPI00324397CC
MNSSTIDTVLTGVTALGAGGILYGTTVGVTAAVAVFAPTPARRRDARAVLVILLRRRPAHSWDSGTQG